MVFIALLTLQLLILFIDSSKNQKEIIKSVDKSRKEIENILSDRKDLVPFANQIKGSQFEFKNMVHSATKSIFIVGPNLNYLADEENKQEIKDLLFQKLKNNPEFKIWMLLSDPEEKELVETMSKVSFTDNFPDELDKAIGEFCEWIKDAKQMKLNNFEVRKTGVITISLLFIDAENEQNACVLVTPIPWNMQGSLRPCFLIKKQQHEYAFTRYHESYRYLFKKKSKGID